MRKCAVRYGSQSCVLNLPRDHGVYIQGQAQIDVQDTGRDNIRGFGYCEKIDGQCTCNLTQWFTTNSTEWVWDINTMSYEATVEDANAYAVCSSGQGFVKMAASGQTASNSQTLSVYITNNKKYIVVNNIYFEIYNPNDDLGAASSSNVDWHTIFSYRMTETEFDLAKALLGYDFSIVNTTRNEVSTESNGTEQYDNGKTVVRRFQNSFVSKNPASGSAEANTILAAGVILEIQDILQDFADAVEHTYVSFYFQMADGGRHRVVLLGGTKNGREKYLAYNHYNVDKSFIHDHVADMFEYIVKRDIQDIVREWMGEIISNINSGKSNSKLLVSESDIELEGNEYYDVILHLKRKRKGKTHQVYLYSSDTMLCQKFIAYPDESFAIVKRSGLYPFGTSTKLVEMINDADTFNGNDKFWSIFEQVLQEQAVPDNEVPLYNPSNASSPRFDSMPDQISDRTPKQSISDLINL